MDNVALSKNLYDAFGRGDIPAVLGAMSPDIRWHQAESNPYSPNGQAVVGLGGEVDHHVHVVVAQHALGVGDVRVHEGDPVADVGQVRLGSRVRQGVQRHDGVLRVVAHPLTDEVRPDEPGRAGDEETHVSLPVR